MSARILLALLLASFSAAARADEIQPPRDIPKGAESPQNDETPAAVRWMIAPLKRGMFVRIPVVDTDPNRGITYGVMPIIVLQGDNDDRIRQIHAPSLTYNQTFKLSPTYRYYYYPQEDSSFQARVSRSKFEHEVMLQFEDRSFADTSYDVLAHVQKTRDAGQHFFGVGPDTPRSAETNYVQDYWQTHWAVGTPLGAGSAWRARLSQRYMSSRILDGPIRGLPTFGDRFPAQYSDRFQQTNETRVSVEYDTRDHSVTTTRGVLLQAYTEAAVTDFLSEYSYERYGVDARWIHPWERLKDHTFAVQFAGEQLRGPSPPFWLMPSLGGKYSLRAYGDGRFVGRGVATLNAEERIKVYEARTAGVTTEIQVAPFAGVGEVFDGPEEGTIRYLRPVVGGAVRAVARPQVVGSVDVGVGRDGVAVFTDINYSF